MNYYEVCHRLSTKGLLCEGRDLKYGLNKVRSHQHRQETMAHFIIKAVVAKLAMAKGDNIVTEHELSQGGSIDVLQLKRRSEVAYEVESGSSKHSRNFPPGVDQIDIKISELPKEVLDAIKVLENHFSKVVI